MYAYVIGGIVGGFVSLYFSFWSFYGPDENILKEFWKDVLQNQPFQKKPDSTFQRFCWDTSDVDTGNRLVVKKLIAYPTPSVFWLKIIKHFFLGVLIGLATVHFL